MQYIFMFDNKTENKWQVISLTLRAYKKHGDTVYAGLRDWYVARPRTKFATSV